MTFLVDIPITSSDFWQNEDEFTEDVMKHVFRSATKETMPLLNDRLRCLREAGQVLYQVISPTRLTDPALTIQDYGCSFTACIAEAKGSAAALVNLLVDKFPCFKDSARFEGRTIQFFKRAQILVADLWACFEGESFGAFYDIDKITMFAGIGPVAWKHLPDD